MWHFLPELPKVNEEALVAMRYDNQPVQAYWNGKDWAASRLVRENMDDAHVYNPKFTQVQDLIYAWMYLPTMPEIPVSKLP